MAKILVSALDPRLDAQIRRYGRRSKKDMLRGFQRMADAAITSPPGTIFDQLELMDHVDQVLIKVRRGSDLRLAILEGWLLIDYAVTYMLRDALQIPERIDKHLRVLPFSFDRKLVWLKKLRDAERAMQPNEDTYRSFTANAQFLAMVRKENQALYKELMKLAVQFESEHHPRPFVVDMPRYTVGRFVPEWWFKKAAQLDNGWFEKCRSLNDARNSAAHHYKLDTKALFREFKVSNSRQFRSALASLIKVLIYGRRSSRKKAGAINAAESSG